MSKWVGYAVSVNCGEPLGCYQGTILEADGTTITLTKAFRNGFPYPKSQVTLNAADIRELRIIEQRAEPFARAHSTVAVSARRGPRATVCETLQANPGVAPAHSGTPAGAGSAAKGDRRRRHEAFLGDCAAALAGDFDFEGNLALFDKQALWQQMRGLGPRPDVVADAGKLRHDENVLAGGGADAGIAVPPALRGERDYVTDDGARVPSVGAVARRQLWRAVRRRRLLPSAAALLARAVADVALRLVGGERRLDPRNSHQAPVVVALVGAHGVGAAGLMAARLLASHGALAACLLLGGEAGEAGEGGEGEGGALARAELAALELADVRVERHAARLPRPDLVLLALHDPAAGEDGAEAGQGEGEGQAEGSGSQEEEEALRWVRAARAGVVALEPPARGWAGVAARAAVVGGLPPSAPPPGAPPSPRLHLANVGAGAALFASLGIAYRPPFGAAAVLALHPADD